MAKGDITINIDTEILQAIQQDITNIKSAHKSEVDSLKSEIESLKRQISNLNKRTSGLKIIGR